MHFTQEASGPNLGSSRFLPNVVSDRTHDKLRSASKRCDSDPLKMFPDDRDCLAKGFLAEGFPSLASRWWRAWRAHVDRNTTRRLDDAWGLTFVRDYQKGRIPLQGLDNGRVKHACDSCRQVDGCAVQASLCDIRTR